MVPPLLPPPQARFPLSGPMPRRLLSQPTSDKTNAPFYVGQLLHPPYSSTSTVSAVPGSIIFQPDSEKYHEVPDVPKGSRREPKTRTKSTVSRWGIAKKDHDLNTDAPSDVNLPVYKVPTRRFLEISQATRPTQQSQDTQKTQNTKRSQQTRKAQQSNGSWSTAPKPRLPCMSNSISTVFSSAYRKRNGVDSIKVKRDTSARLRQLRELMAKDELDYYVAPSEDAHQSEYVAASDKRTEFVSGFSGSAGQAIVSKSSAYLITDSRYWLQAQEQLDKNWILVRAGSVEGPKDWIEWLVGRVNKARIGIDAHMLSHEKALLLNAKFGPLDCKLFHPPQNLVDLVWKNKPSKPREPVHEQGAEFTGKDARHKLTKLREWIRQQPASPSLSKTEPTHAQMHVGTLITSLSHIAYILNLRGSDLPFSPLFHAYLFVGIDDAIVFLDASQVNKRVADYLKSIRVERKDYKELWPFLRRRRWGEGKLLISPQTSYAISLTLTRYQYTVAPSQVEHMMAIKNGTEIDNMRRAHLRGGSFFVRFFSWLENKLSTGYDITEYEAFARLMVFASLGNKIIGFTHNQMSASGPNAALPRYSPTKSSARIIRLDEPYLTGAGIHYRDGICEDARTMHFGRPTVEQYGHSISYEQIAIASAVFMEGTSSDQLATLSHKALFSQSGLDFMHGSECARICLSVRDSPQGFVGNIPLMAGHIVSIDPSLHREGKWGIRIQSSYVVRRIKAQDDSNEDTFLGFERLTCVPIQRRMVKTSMLTKAEKAWLKDHNQSCREMLSPWLLDDKQALSWLKREASSGFGFLRTPASPSIEWAPE